MVLQTERYPGGYQQQSYNAYQGPNGNYSSFQGITPPYSTYPQVSNYPSPHAPQNQFGRPSGGDYYGNGASAYPGARPTTGGYGNSYYENSQSHGSTHGHGSPHSHGGQHGYGGGATNHFDKPTYGHNGYGGGHNGYGGGHNGYGSGSPNYGYSPSGMNQGCQKPSWILKGLDDEE